MDSAQRVSIKALTEPSAVLLGIPVVEPFSDLRAFVEQTDEVHAREHAEHRAEYFDGRARDRSPPRATVKLTFSEDRAASVVTVTTERDSASVVVQTEQRATGAFLGFGAVVDAVAAVIGVPVARLTAVMRFSGITHERQATNLLQKVGARGKSLTNNPEDRKGIKLTLEPHFRCDACHAPSAELWRREFEKTGVVVAVCTSTRCRVDTVKVLGVHRTIKKVHNLKRVVFVSN